MRIAMIAAATAALAMTTGCATYGGGDAWRSYGNYDYDRPDPRYGGYDAERYYRGGPSYRERRLAQNDRI